MNRICRVATVVLTLIVCNSFIFGQQPKWHARLLRIVALDSTKSEVETVFKDLLVKRSFVENDTNVVLYETADGKLSAVYTNEDCSPGGPRANVPKYTLLDLIFFPKQKLPLSTFDIDLDDFTEVDDPHDPGSEYVSARLGITYSVQSNRVIFVRISPKSIDALIKCR